MATVETRNYADGPAVHRVRFRHGTNARTGKPIQTSETFTTKTKAERFAKLVDAVGAREALDRLYSEDYRDDIPTRSLQTTSASSPGSRRALGSATPACGTEHGHPSSGTSSPTP